MPRALAAFAAFISKADGLQLQPVKNDPITRRRPDIVRSTDRDANATVGLSPALISRAEVQEWLKPDWSSGGYASTTEAGNFSLAQLADDVLVVADAAGLEKFAIAGVSLGGMIAMELALCSPERVERLMLVCTSATMDSAAWSDRVAKVRDEGMAGIVDLAMGRFLSDAAELAIFETVRRQFLRWIAKAMRVAARRSAIWTSPGGFPASSARRLL